MRISQISALALAAALSLGGLAIAQDASPPSPAAAHQGWDREAMHKHMQDHMAEHVKLIHDALNIRPDQEGAFNAMVGAMHPAMGDHEGMEGMHHEGMGEDHDQMTAMSTPERLDMMTRMMDQHIAKMREHMQSMVGSVKALYAVLSPEQRHTFDALATMMLAHGHGMGHEHGGMEGMGHGDMGHRDMGDEHHE